MQGPGRDRAAIRLGALVLALGLMLAVCGPAAVTWAASPAQTTPGTTTPGTTTPGTTTTVPTGPPSGALGVGDVGFAQAYLPVTESNADLAADFDTIKSLGATWVRFDVSWNTVQSAGPTKWNWSAVDRAVRAARARNLEVLPILAYTPPWARPHGTTDKHAPDDVAAFANFARVAVARYAPKGVRAWEVWNEENISTFWQPAPSATAYAALLRAASAAIRSVDGGATVIVGGLAPVGPRLDWQSSDGSEVSPFRYLRELYQRGAAPTFDAVADHPYAALPNSPTAEVAGNGFLDLDDLHRLMVRYGDGDKRIWGTEAGAYTGTATGAVSERTQAKYLTSYITGWRAWDFTGPLFLYTLRDLGTNAANREQNWGILRANHSKKLAVKAVRRLLKQVPR